MERHRRESAPDGERWEDNHYRCSYCGTVNDYRTVKIGGRVAPNFSNTAQTTYTDIQGFVTTVYTPNPSADGCILCGSPDSDGYAEPSELVKRFP